jgi:hypothetical protein
LKNIFDKQPDVKKYFDKQPDIKFAASCKLESKFTTDTRHVYALSSAEAYMKFLVRERERARSDGKS